MIDQILMKHRHANTTYETLVSQITKVRSPHRFLSQLRDAVQPVGSSAKHCLAAKDVSITLFLNWNCDYLDLCDPTTKTFYDFGRISMLRILDKL